MPIVLSLTRVCRRTTRSCTGNCTAAVFPSPGSAVPAGRIPVSPCVPAPNSSRGQFRSFWFGEWWGSWVSLSSSVCRSVGVSAWSLNWIGTALILGTGLYGKPIAKKMPAYSIVAVTVTDPERFQRYVEGHRDTLSKFGGRFLAAGPEFDRIEGNWPGQLVVLHEWPDRDAFHSWYESDDYRPWKAMRFSSATAHVVSIDGLPAELPSPV